MARSSSRSRSPRRARSPSPKRRRVSRSPPSRRDRDRARSPKASSRSPKRRSPRRARSPSSRSPKRRSRSPRRWESPSKQREERDEGSRGDRGSRWDDARNKDGGGAGERARERRDRSRWDDDKGLGNGIKQEEGQGRPLLEPRKCFNCQQPGHDAKDCPIKVEGDGGRRAGGGGGGRAFLPPPIYSVHQGRVARVADFGFFVEMEGMGPKWGLVHVSQIQNKAGEERIDVAEIVKLDDKVWVKVIDIDVEKQKISLSMKYVDQTTGQDLDTFQVQLQKDKDKEESRRNSQRGKREFDPFAANKKEEEDYKNHKWGAPAGGGGKEVEEEGPKEEKSFALSGLLAKETRMFQGIELKFTEPADARMPDKKWRLYEFKGDEALRTLHLHRCSCYVFGRDRHLNKYPGFVPTDHPSCSGQHAVIQYKLHEEDDGVGGIKLSVRPYIMDLVATNGTFINGERIEDMRYYELKERDCIKFGNSSRDYVLLHDGSINSRSP